VLDGNPEPDLVHTTGCKEPTLRNEINLGNRLDPYIIAVVEHCYTGEHGFQA
jgi:hypothetical protein